MISIILFVQTITTILEDSPKDVNTLLYIACCGMASVITYMFIAHKKEIKQKDDAIMKVMEEHRNDIKESNKDYKSVVDKFSQFMYQIESIINIKK